MGLSLRKQKEINNYYRFISNPNKLFLNKLQIFSLKSKGRGRKNGLFKTVGHTI